MSKVIKTAVTKPAEYKEYVHFLGSYKNGKKDDCDSGINSPLDKSVNSSSTSVNSDLNIRDEDCVRMKTEITIDIKEPPKRVLGRKGSVKKMSEIFEGGEKKTFRRDKPSLEKLLLKDQTDGVVNKVTSPKPPKFPVVKNGKPSLEKLLQEDALNAKQNVGEPEVIKPEKFFYNKEASMNSENIFTTLRKVETKKEDNIVVENVVCKNKEVMETEVCEKEIVDNIVCKKEEVVDDVLCKKEEVVQKENNAPPPPPPPPMPTATTTIKRSATLPKPITTTQKTQKEVNDLLETERKKLAYEALRGIMGNYHEQANVIAHTLPRNQNLPNGKIGDIISTMARNGDLDKIKGRSAPKKE